MTRNHVVYRRSSITAANDGPVFDAHSSGDVFKAKALGAELVKDDVPAVPVLRVPVGPDAIRFRVPEVIFDSLDRMLRGGTRAHVGKERGEVVAPCRAYGYASPAVIWKCFLCRVKASRNDASPGNIFWSSAPAVASSKRPNDFPLGASARFCPSELCRSYDCASTAIAACVPVSGGVRHV